MGEEGETRPVPFALTVIRDTTALAYPELPPAVRLRVEGVEALAFRATHVAPVFEQGAAAAHDVDVTGTDLLAARRRDTPVAHPEVEATIVGRVAPGRGS